MGSGTNRVTSFLIGELHFYNQTSAGTPTLDPSASFAFEAGTVLASNRTATAISVKLPTNVSTNLNRSPVAQESFTAFAASTNLTSFQAAFPSGDYVFNVQGTPAEQVTVNFPASLTQPAAPHVNNYPAAQAVDASRPFLLSWDAFAGGTAADFIAVQIGDVFRTADIGQSNALAGTATSISIPAGTLQPLTNYPSSVVFYRFLATTNGAGTEASEVFRATSTQFTLVTVVVLPPVPLVLTNAAWSANGLTFEVTSSESQALTVEYSTTLAPGSWEKLVSTNSATGRVQISDPASKTDPNRTYRARKSLVDNP